MAKSIACRKKLFGRAALKKSAIIFGALVGIYLLLPSLLILSPHGELFVSEAAAFGLTAPYSG